MQKMAAKICYVFERHFCFATDRENIAMWQADKCRRAFLFA